VFVLCVFSFLFFKIFLNIFYSFFLLKSVKKQKTTKHHIYPKGPSYICVYVYVCKCVYVYMCMCVYVFYVFMFRCVYVFNCIGVYLCVYMCMCVYVYLCRCVYA